MIAELSDLFANNKIFINTDYQRGDIWTPIQKVELIESINNRYSIGVIVLYLNDNGRFEILDGQQRLLTICQYINGTLDLMNSNMTPYSGLDKQEKALLDAYCIYYIRLKSQDPDNKEEDIIQTFLRLQEGTPLNKAEKLNAYRGKFKDTFRETRENHPIFTFLGKEKRFRWRQLSSEMLALELEGDFKNKIFPSLDLTSMKSIVRKYEKNISQNKIQTFKANLDFLTSSLNIILTGFDSREFISFYLLASYLRKYKANNANLINEFAEFAVEFLKNLHLFSIYDTKPPLGMKKRIFDTYKNYKLESKVMTTSESLKKRLEIMLLEYDRLNTIIIKDSQRLFDVAQKRDLYFRQKGLCGYCGRKMIFRLGTGHHVIAHSEGGRTADLDKSVLLHENCHRQVEKLILKAKEPVFLSNSV
ncbi:MAG: DUF262 domain-containing protein [Dehalococcoidales bacterium]|nr:DUF262 domain-containing protein [Dehalococcoidales bacterium]